MDAAAETAQLLTIAMPFSLNQPADVFDTGPTDDAEWAAHTAGILLRPGVRFEDAVREAWAALATSGEPIRGGVSTQAALRNLRNNIQPPRSGRENPHYFDDGAMCRAVPVGIVWAGDPQHAAEHSHIDACVTNAEDGVWAAQAMAASVSLACAGESAETCIRASMELLPRGSLVRRTVEEALALSRGSGTLFSILPALQDAIVNREYSYGNAAPETLALAFVIVRMAGGHDFERAVTTAASVAKTADALPAVVGALAGALNAGEIASDSWRRAITTLKGIAIPSMAGMNYLELTERLAQRAGAGR